MKNFLIKALILSIIILFFVSCSIPEKDDDFEDRNSQFFKVVYIALASRVEGSTNWTSVLGQARIKFDRAEGQEETQTNLGVFTVHYTDYKEMQSGNTVSSFCSGGFKGEFTLSSAVASSEDSVKGPYNPLDPYDPEVPGTEAEAVDVSRLVFIFNLNIQEKNMPGCHASLDVPSPSSKLLRIIRFGNGDLLITDPSRGLEFYYIPEINNSSTPEI